MQPIIQHSPKALGALESRGTRVACLTARRSTVRDAPCGHIRYRSPLTLERSFVSRVATARCAPRWLPLTAVLLPEDIPARFAGSENRRFSGVCELMGIETATPFRHAESARSALSSGFASDSGAKLLRYDERRRRRLSNHPSCIFGRSPRCCSAHRRHGWSSGWSGSPTASNVAALPPRAPRHFSPPELE